MNITILSTSFPRFEGDFAGTFVHHWAQGLFQNGNNVCVIAPDDKEVVPAKSDKTLLVSRFRYFWPYRVQSFAYGAGVLSRLQKNPLRIFQAPFFMLAFFYRAMKIADKTDLFYSFWFPCACVGVAVKFFKGIPVVARLSGSDLLFIQSPFTSFFVRSILKRTQIIVCQDQKFYSALVQLGVPEKKIINIANGLDMQLFHPIPKDEARKHLNLETKEKYILAVGRLSKSKGHSCLIQAFNKLLESNQDLRLIIVGDGEERENLKNLAVQLNIADKITFTGFQKNNLIPLWLNSADIFILPSQLEGTPNILLEAMACGLPVIATKVGGVEEIIKNQLNGLLIEPNSIMEIENAIEQFLGNPLIRKNMGEAALKTISEQFTDWTQQAQLLEKEINQKLN